MDFRRQIVTCLFSMFRLSFETQKLKRTTLFYNKYVCLLQECFNDIISTKLLSTKNDRINTIFA